MFHIIGLFCSETHRTIVYSFPFLWIEEGDKDDFFIALVLLWIFWSITDSTVVDVAEAYDTAAAEDLLLFSLSKIFSFACRINSSVVYILYHSIVVYFPFFYHHLLSQPIVPTFIHFSFIINHIISPIVLPILQSFQFKNAQFPIQQTISIFFLLPIFNHLLFSYTQSSFNLK